MAELFPGTGGLSDAMDFDSVVTVCADGAVIDGPSNLYAPDLLDEQLSGDGWEFFTYGYSGQDRYSGPIMHNSEQIGGGLARDILATPGIYSVVAAYWGPDEDSEDEGSDIEGWAVVRYTGGPDAVVCDCGHPAVPTRWGNGKSGIPGYARDARTDATLCYPCADRAQRADMAAGAAVVAYVASDGRSVTTWTGGTLARVTGHTAARTGWHRSEVFRYWATAPDGSRWFGMNGGPGMAIRLRRLAR